MGVIDRSVGRGVTRKYDDDNRAKKLYKNVWAQSLKSLKKSHYLYIGLLGTSRPGKFVFLR